MKELKFAVFGAGFWSNYQIAGWKELPGLKLSAICDPEQEKARAMAEKFGIPQIYTNPKDLLSNEQDLDFIDIITEVDNHLPLAQLAASRGINVVCQKPMAPSLPECKQMVESCKTSGVKLFINENFRWQAPLRRVKQLLDNGNIGAPFKARVSFCSGFPVFDNQPFLRTLDRFILTDIGSHILDICRFLFGEARNLRCLTRRVNPDIKGEDIANVLLEMTSGLHCYAEMSYASILEDEVFPQTLVLVEGEYGSIELCSDYTVKITNRQGTIAERHNPQLYSWVDPDYALVHSSIVDTQANLLQGLRGGEAETTGDDNLQTSKLIWASYYSAENNELVDLANFNHYE
ncbi:MAG: oxidoreductase [Cyclobacteriaceae bacterium]|nr:MAG: oxidoreductase [Cyclobacteriaceae bacterium]